MSPSGGAPDIPVYRSIDELLAGDEGIEAVAMCQPPQVRFDAAMKAVRAGKHVLLEKPPGATLAEVRALTQAAADKGVTLFAAWHSRFAHGVEPARGFDWLGEPVVLVALGVATAAEVAAYYLPGVDHVLDLLGAPVAVLAGIVAAAGVMVGLPDWLRWLTAIGAGGAFATASHALNAVGRAKTGAVSGGIGNPAYSTAELAGSVMISALALILPVIAVIALVALGAWMLKRRRRRPV